MSACNLKSDDVIPGFVKNGTLGKTLFVTFQGCFGSLLRLGEMAEYCMYIWQSKYKNEKKKQQEIIEMHLHSMLLSMKCAG